MEKAASFQTESAIVCEHRLKKNYLVIDEPASLDSDEKVAAIYFSSNAIYYPNDNDTFTKEIVSKDRYEWFGNRYELASRHIFVRDIYKQWYVEGINEETNTLESLINLLDDLVTGYSVVTIGSSAGGYAATLVGCVLNAKEVLCFATQFNLWSEADLNNQARNPLLVGHRDNIQFSKYYGLNKFIATSAATKIHYFSPYFSEDDIKQTQYAASIGSSNLHIYRFNSRRHGIPFLPTVLPQLFSKNGAKILSGLRGSDGQILSSFWFSLRHSKLTDVFRFISSRVSSKFG